MFYCGLNIGSYLPPVAILELKKWGAGTAGPRKK